MTKNVTPTPWQSARWPIMVVGLLSLHAIIMLALLARTLAHPPLEAPDPLAPSAPGRPVAAELKLPNPNR